MGVRPGIAVDQLAIELIDQGHIGDAAVDAQILNHAAGAQGVDDRIRILVCPCKGHGIAVAVQHAVKLLIRSIPGVIAHIVCNVISQLVVAFTAVFRKLGQFLCGRDHRPLLTLRQLRYRSRICDLCQFLDCTFQRIGLLGQLLRSSGRILQKRFRRFQCCLHCRETVIGVPFLFTGHFLDLSLKSCPFFGCGCGAVGNQAVDCRL